LNENEPVGARENLSLQCVIETTSTDMSLVSWRIAWFDGVEILVQEEMNDSFITASFGYNSANLLIQDEFEGIISCVSSDLGYQQTIIVVEGRFD